MPRVKAKSHGSGVVSWFSFNQKGRFRYALIIFHLSSV